MALQQSLPLVLYIDTLRGRIEELFGIGIIPEDFLDDLGEKVGIVSFAIGHEEAANAWSVTASLEIDAELAIQIPGLDQLKLIIGTRPEAQSTNLIINLAARYAGDLYVSLQDIDVILQIDGMGAVQLLNESAGGRYILGGARLAPQEAPIRIFSGAGCTLSFSTDGQIAFSGPDDWSIDPFCIPAVGLGLKAAGLRLRLTTATPFPPALAAAGLPSDWVGIALDQVQLFTAEDSALRDGLQELSFEHFSVGRGGVSGHITGTWTPQLAPDGQSFSGPGSGALFDIPFALRSVAVELKQNTFIAAAVGGALILPFFDTPLGIDLSIGADASFAARLSDWQPTGAPATNGLITLKKPGLLDLMVESIAFALADGVFSMALSGVVTPRIQEGTLEWPTFRVQELRIDSQGNVRLEGGWLDLPEQQSFSFYGFKIEITKLGFGKSEDGGKWIGLSGAIHLIEGLPAGVSVQGLRITWDDGRPPRITLDGVGVELEIPNVLRFKGFVAYRELPGDVHRFDGRVKVELIALNLEVDALIVIGSHQRRPFFAIYLGLDLPAGIPLWATGLGLYGIAGLFALEMAPNRRPEEGWYENPDGGPGWYKRPEEGVTDLINKWDPMPGGLGLGGGIMIGTVADNGFTFSGKLTLVIVLPGPILMLEGRANILASRSRLNEPDPLLRCLAVLDAGAGSFLFGLDARYRFGGGGELIDIRGSAEVFFSFSDASLWHIYVGRREPRERRVSAQIIQLFEANAYFMLDARELALGAWIGYAADWEFGPLRAVLEAWMEGNVAVSWRPVHFHGDYWVHGKVHVSAFGIGAGLSVDVRLAADVFDPFHLLGEFSVGVYPPWPLPDIEVTITLEWGPELDAPPIPEPLQEVAIEHMKVSTKWPIPIEGDRQPGNDPVVPLDCRPRITFGRSVHCGIDGINNSQMPWKDALPQGWERIGDPSANQGPVLVRYTLTELVLQQWNAAARRWDSVPQPMNGSWAAVPQIPLGEPLAGSDPPVANTKLWLWSKSGFDYTRTAGRSWEEWFTDRFPGYPCVPAVPVREVCWDFELLPAGTSVFSRWRCPEEPDIVLYWVEPARQTVTVVAQPAQGMTHAICFPSTRRGPAPADPVLPNQVILQLPRGVATVRLVVRDQERVEAIGIDSKGNRYPPVYGGLPNDPQLKIQAANFERIMLHGFSQMCIFRICVEFAPLPEVVAERDRLDRNQQTETVRWSQQDCVLQPDRTYRLRIRTTVEAQGEGELAGWEPSPNPVERTQYAYFRTEGPPGLANLSIPAGLLNTEESKLRNEAGDNVRVDGTPSAGPVLKSELNSLAPYVRQTVPATVPRPGERPPLPRPVFRAYDIGVEFNENYVDLLYRSRGRSLSLYLFDNNNRPVRDAAGRVIILPNRWGNTAQLHLEESEERWVTTINRNGCGGIDRQNIVRDNTLASAGLVLDADTIYEARLLPLLFEGPGKTLEGWEVVDEGVNQRPSKWYTLQEGSGLYITQASDIWGGSPSPLDPVKPGTMLLRPDDWTDYRFSVTLQNKDDDAIGVVFRYRDTSNYYCFSMDRERRYRRLVRVVGGEHTVLAEDNFVYEVNTDYVIAVEAIGASLRVYQGDDLIFAVSDASIRSGRVGLYCWQSRGARFGYMRVDDFRERPPVLYRYAFTTSRYTNFNHQLHSFNDERWLLAPAISDEAWNAAINKGSDPANLPSDDEMRAYDSLAQELPLQPRERVEVTRIERGGNAVAFLVEGPEPFDWTRTNFSVQRAAASKTAPRVPDALKLTAISRATIDPNDEWVELLLRDGLSLEGKRIEWTANANLIDRSDLDGLLPTDRFPRPPAPVFPKWREYYRFGTEPFMPAGTRIRVYSGAQANAHDMEPGILRRFVATAGERGQICFGNRPVTLRIAGGHRRSFPSGYVDESVRVLRKRDGTGFLVLPTSQRFLAGDYRFKLTYSRDVSKAQPGTQVLSEAGVTSDEISWIDVPWSGPPAP